jgi:hypothetical protein
MVVLVAGGASDDAHRLFLAQNKIRNVNLHLHPKELYVSLHSFPLRSAYSGITE